MFHLSVVILHDLKAHSPIYIHLQSRVILVLLFSLSYYHLESSILKNQISQYSISYSIQPVCGEPLVVYGNEDCSLVTAGNWSSITIKSHSCSFARGNLVIAGLSCLQYIIAEKEVFRDVFMLELSNNPLLEFVYIGKRSFINSRRLNITGSSQPF